ncbi:YobI family P-loop NTPase [Gordonia terrae]
MAEKKSAEKPLESLTPKYEDKHHGTYLKRLQQAVKDPNNVNIALTGRYGAGKSSVLNKFEARNKRAVLRLAISTLAPGEEGESTTNRIQKEIVKQLLYGASEKVGKNSRFNKIAVLSRHRAFMQSLTVVLPLVGLAYIFGVLPQMKWPTEQDPTWWRVATWVAAIGFVTILGAVVRLSTHGRYDVKDVSAGGAALTLSEKPQTFFDKYIDEIVHYFAQEPKDIVIFEDLDRFEDPNIFEALRELNVLLNDTPERRKKRKGHRLGRVIAYVIRRMNREWPGRLEKKLPYPWAGRVLGLGEPLRFIYAVRDSVFSQIDATPAEGSRERATAGPTQPVHEQDSCACSPELDEAAAETLRANRTKFFDIVIPLVPFISHRNARDLLVGLLDEREITGIDSRLVNTVAQHCTDMRLMRNMCNEYLVFAERLLEPTAPTTSAPGLDATHLFALVAYKNFHLEDFENITRRDSDLDKVYDFAQRLARNTISAHETRIRELLAKPERFRQREPRATQLGQRLDLLASNVKRALSTQYNQYQLHRFKVGTQEFDADKVNDYKFWGAIAIARSLEIVLVQQPGGSSTVGHTFDEAGLEMFVPEALDADRWAAFDQAAIDTEVATKDGDIEMLRRADFADLVTTEFTLVLRPGEAVEKKLTRLKNPGKSHTFADLADATLKSELARDLVRRGYIDRNYSLYAAQFYGNFTGIDVANFMVQHVQPNIMSINYDLSRPKDGTREGAAANLLIEAEEAGEDLLNTAVAYNIDLVNHLLETGDAGAFTVARNLISAWPGEKARSFLAAYFTSKKAQREKLAALLTLCRWREVFTYLTSHDDVPADARVTLLNSALAAFEPGATYDLGENVGDFLTSNYHSMSVFTGKPEAPAERHSLVDGTKQISAEQLAQRLNTVLRRANVVLPELAPLSDAIRMLVVEGNRYSLTAENLRFALGLADSDPVPLETLAEDDKSGTIYPYALANLPSYLAAVDDDEHTTAALTTPPMLARVLVDMVEQAVEEESEDHVRPGGDFLTDLLAHSSTTARLRNVLDAPRVTWKALAEAKLFRSSLANIEAYRDEIGSIDEHLARLMQDAAAVHVDEDGDTIDSDGEEYDRQAAAIAIVNTGALTPEVRVALVTSLRPPTPLVATDINAERSDLFALLLGAGLVSDDEDTFTHLRGGGWAALRPSIIDSGEVEAFLSSAILDGMVANALADDSTAGKVAGQVLADVNEYVPKDDWAELQAVAIYADQHRLALDPGVVARIARVGDAHDRHDVTLMLGLLDRASPPASADHIVETFLHLGQPYNRIANSQDSFDLEFNAVHDRLLKVLHGDNRITRGYPRLPRRRYSVNVT